MNTSPLGAVPATGNTGSRRSTCIPYLAIFINHERAMDAELTLKQVSPSDRLLRDSAHCATKDNKDML